jgi:hypothetical protein
MNKNNSWIVWIAALIAVVALILAIVALGKISATGEAISWRKQNSNVERILIDIKDCKSPIATFPTNVTSKISCDSNRVLGITPIVHCLAGSVPYVEYWGAANPSAGINLPNVMIYSCVNSYGSYTASPGVEGLCCKYFAI